MLMSRSSYRDLPLRDLLLAKGVCRQFGDVMDGSAKIRQALFFEPSLEVTNAEIAIIDTYTPNIRRLLRNPNSIIDHNVHYLPEGVTDYVAMNPLLAELISQTICQHLDYGDGPLYQHRSLQMRNPRALARLITSPSNSSWRRMLLLQPHAAWVTMTFDVDDWSPVRCLDAPRVLVRQGLMMSSLVDFSDAHIGQRAEMHLLPDLIVRVGGRGTATSHGMRRRIHEH